MGVVYEETEGSSMIIYNLNYWVNDGATTWRRNRFRGESRFWYEHTMFEMLIRFIVYKSSRQLDKEVKSYKLYLNHGLGEISQEQTKRAQD